MENVHEMYKKYKAGKLRWKTGDGRDILLEDLNYAHLINIIKKMILSKDEKLFIFEEELEKRLRERSISSFHLPKELEDLTKINDIRLKDWDRIIAKRIEKLTELRLAIGREQFTRQSILDHPTVDEKLDVLTEGLFHILDIIQKPKKGNKRK